jgi:hypothetical protein
MQPLQLSWGLPRLMGCAGVSEHDGGNIGEQLMMDASASACAPGTENYLAEVASIREITASDATLETHCSGATDRGAVCGLLMIRLLNVSFCFVGITVSFACYCVCDFCLSSC